MALDFCPPVGTEQLFHARTEYADGTACVSLHGEFDIAGVELFEEECERVAARGIDVARLDLEGLTFMDVAGLRSLVSAMNRARDNGRNLIVVNARPAIRRMFDLTGNSCLLATTNGEGCA